MSHGAPTGTARPRTPDAIALRAADHRSARPRTSYRARSPRSRTEPPSRQPGYIRIRAEPSAGDPTLDRTPTAVAALRHGLERGRPNEVIRGSPQMSWRTGQAQPRGRSGTRPPPRALPWVRGPMARR